MNALDQLVEVGPPDPRDTFKRHFSDMLEGESEELRADLSALFDRQAVVLTRAMNGESVVEEQLSINAQLRLLESGAAAKVTSTFWEAANDYAVKIARFGATFLKSAALAFFA